MAMLSVMILILAKTIMVKVLNIMAFSAFIPRFIGLWWIWLRCV